MSVRNIYHQFLGELAAGGEAKFFEPGTSTSKNTYTDENYNVSAGSIINIDANGWIKTYLSGDYDIDVFDKNGGQLAYASAEGINPQEVTIDSQSQGLIVNGSFETDSNADNIPDGWNLINYSGSTNSLVTNDQRAGARAMRFLSTGNGGGQIESTDFIAINQDQNYVLSFSIKSSVANIRNVVEIIFYTSSFSQISVVEYYDNDSTNSTSWERLFFDVDPPNNTRYCKIRITGAANNNSNPGNVLFDDVRLSISVPEAFEIDTFRFFDDFDDGNLTSNIPYDLRQGSSVSTPNPALLQTSAFGGVAEFTTGNNSAGTFATNGIQLYTDEFFSSGSSKCKFGARVQPSSIVQQAFFFGLVSGSSSLEMPFSYSNSSTLVAERNNSTGFLFDTTSGHANLILVGVADGTQATPIDTGIAVVDDSYVKIEFEIDTNGNAYFYIDNEFVGVLEDAISANGEGRRMTIAAFSRTNSVNRLKVDYIYGEQERF